jgi:diguanylate cyclase (GGDEF)-like protein
MQITFVYAFLTFLFVGIVSFFVWRANREEIAFRYWAVSGFMQGAGWGLFALNLSDPSAIHLHSISESLIFAGHVSSYLALAQFTLRRIGRLQLSTWAVLIAAFFVLDLVCRINTLRAWDGAVALAHAIVNLLMVAMLLRERRSATYGIVYTASTVYLLIVAATLKKVFDVFFGAIQTAEITAQADVNSAVVLSATMAVIVGTVALSLLQFSRTAQRLNELAGQDPLTGALNRRAWRAAIEKECARVRRRGTRFSVMMIDIDDFKQVNDKYGHAAGDQVLTASAGIIAAQLRKGDTLSRFGGEEFVALLVDAHEQGAAAMAERIRETVAASAVDWEGSTFSVTCSIGIAEFDPARDTADSVVARADKAMYQAKSQGRNRVVTGSAKGGEFVAL